MRPSGWFALIVILSLMLMLPASMAFADQAADRKAYEENRDLILAIHPYLTPAEIYNRFTPLAVYLTEKLGRLVTIRISPNYSEHINIVGRGHADIAFMGPASYVRMTERYGAIIPLIATLQVDGKSTFRGVIIARKGSGIRRITDLIGKSFAFGDIQSTMSHIVPRFMMFESGVPVEALKRYRFLTNHENVAMGVLYGKFDAGAVKQEVFKEYEYMGLKSVARTPQVAEHLFVASHKLPTEMVIRIREAFLDLNSFKVGGPVLLPVKSSITGLVPASDHDYDNLRHMMRTLEAIGAFEVDAIPAN